MSDDTHMELRIIGDVHGLVQKYITIAGAAPNSVQVGDMAVGFAGVSVEDLTEFHADGTHHQFIRGNHDDPAMVMDMPGSIVDGTYDEEYGIMYVGGAWSIDHQWRRDAMAQGGAPCWWANEELTITELMKVYADYAYYKPKIMITHDCPQSIPVVMQLLNPAFGGMKPTRTGQAFESMFQKHQPDYWYFGHWHNDAKRVIGSTQFQCLNELSYVDILVKPV